MRLLREGSTVHDQLPSGVFICRKELIWVIADARVYKGLHKKSVKSRFYEYSQKITARIRYSWKNGIKLSV